MQKQCVSNDGLDSVREVKNSCSSLCEGQVENSPHLIIIILLESLAPFESNFLCFCHYHVSGIYIICNLIKEVPRERLCRTKRKTHLGNALVVFSVIDKLRFGPFEHDFSVFWQLSKSLFVCACNFKFEYYGIFKHEIGNRNFDEFFS